MRACISVFRGILITMALGGWAGGLGAQVLQVGPLNPAFCADQEMRAKQPPAVRTATGHSLGHRPTPWNLAHLRGQALAKGGAARAALPAVYDLRTTGKLPAVRNQGSHGTCWAFASYGSLESCLLPAELRNFSVNNLVNLAGYDFTYEDGGMAAMSIAYLARWSGPVNESDDPYNTYGVPSPSPAGLPVQKHVQNAIVLPLKANALDNDTIKLAVTQYGAVYIGMCYEDEAYNGAHSSFYYHGTNYANHAVAIVGWDDTYPAGRFNDAPQGNGAFIVRNSWSADWGEGGYFYCSYYDTVMGYDEQVCFYNAETNANYSGLYQYDPLGWINTLGYSSSTTAWGANIFTATTACPVQAVGFYNVDVNTHYAIHVYSGVTANQPRSGTLVTSQSGTLAYPGYYTVALNTLVPLAAGQRFAVVIQLTASQTHYPMAVEYAIPDYSSRATAAPGQSFISPDGNSWQDMTEWDSTANACIKAYAGAAMAPSRGPDIRINGLTNDVSVGYGANVSVTVQIEPGQYTGVSADWWIIAATPDGWCYYGPDFNWQVENDLTRMLPVYEGALFNLGATTVLSASTLARGAYGFYFAVSPRSGHLDINDPYLWHKRIGLNVE